METRYTAMDLDVDYFLQLSSFLDPRFKLAYVKDTVKVLEGMEKQILDCYSSERIMTESPNEDVDSGQPPAKKSKGLTPSLLCWRMSI